MVLSRIATFLTFSCLIISEDLGFFLIFHAIAMFLWSAANMLKTLQLLGKSRKERNPCILVRRRSTRHCQKVRPEGTEGGGTTVKQMCNASTARRTCSCWDSQRKRVLISGLQSMLKTSSPPPPNHLELEGKDLGP